MQKPFGLDGADGFQSCTHGQRIATKGRAVIAGLEEGCRLAVGKHCADRHPRAQSFGEWHDIR